MKNMSGIYPWLKPPHWHQCCTGFYHI